MLEKINCFAFERHNKQFKCSALKVENCLNCVFYKELNQYVKECKKAPKTQIIDGKVVVVHGTR